MPSHHRVPSGSTRASYADSVPQPQTSTSRRDGRSVSFAEEDRAAEDVQEALNDALKRAYTELNKTRDEKDRLERNHEQMKVQFQATTQEIIRLKEMLRQAKEEHDATKLEVQDWIQSYQDMKKRHDELYVAYDSLASLSAPHSKASSTENTKGSKASSAETRGSKKEHRDRERDGRSRTRDSDRDRDRREAKEQQAEKDRLSRRFDTDKRPPKTRRNSHIEGWGPSGRSTSAQPPRDRAGTGMASGRKQAPAPIISQGISGGYTGHNVPRTPINPLSPNGGGTTYSSGGSSTTYDGESYEDGNYHAYPIQRS